jgi:hypothetical protein
MAAKFKDRQYQNDFMALMKRIDDDMQTAHNPAYTSDQLRMYANDGLTILSDMNDATFCFEEGLRWLDACVLSYQHEFVSHVDLLSMLEWYVNWMNILLNEVPDAPHQSQKDHEHLKALDEKILELQMERDPGLDHFEAPQLWAYMESGLDEITNLDDITLVQKKGLVWLQHLVDSANTEFEDEEGNDTLCVDENEITELVQYYSTWSKTVMGIDEEEEEEEIFDAAMDQDLPDNTATEQTSSSDTSNYREGELNHHGASEHGRERHYRAIDTSKGSQPENTNHSNHYEFGESSFRSRSDYGRQPYEQGYSSAVVKSAIRDSPPHRYHSPESNSLNRANNNPHQRSASDHQSLVSHRVPDNQTQSFGKPWRPLHP